ncbi:MAG: hypothetical protein J0I41_22870 [Filimonas sp.]|nr:hypothetical protein [Filimonas sp.]
MLMGYRNGGFFGAGGAPGGGSGCLGSFTFGHFIFGLGLLSGEGGFCGAFTPGGLGGALGAGGLGGVCAITCALNTSANK